jgi:FkbM family methyltransferase
MASSMDARVLRVLRNAFLSKGFRLFGPAFSRDYLRFAWRASRRWGYAGPGVLDLLGFRIEYPNQSHALFLLHEIFAQGVYWFSSTRTRPHIVDCGANIGMAVIFFKALFSDAQVTAIEPDAATFDQLRRNVDRNRLAGVTLVNAAVTERSGPVLLHGGARTGGGLTASLDPAWGGSDHREARGVTLSSLLESDIDFLKLDVEGAEYGIVRDLVASGRIRLIHEAVIEQHPIGHEADGAQRMVEALRAADLDVTTEPGQPGSPTKHLRARRRVARK